MPYTILGGKRHSALLFLTAYRRDRRKDALLQEHGYFVLRFLSTDIGKCLNETLDSILRTVVHCCRQVSED